MAITADGRDAVEYECPVCKRMHICRYGPRFAGFAPVPALKCPWCDCPLPESAPDGHRCECGAILTNAAP